MSENRQTYLYVSVVFPGSNHLYSYKTTDTSIKAGDYVVVPVSGKSPQTVLVKKVEYYTEKDAPYPVEKTKDVIGHASGKKDSERQKYSGRTNSTFSRNDAQNLIDKYQRLLSDYEEIGRYKENIISAADRLIRSEEGRTVYLKQIEDYLDHNEPVKEGNRVSKQLILCLYKLKMISEAFAESERFYNAYKNSVENAVSNLSVASGSLKWFFTSQDKKRLAVSAYQYLADEVDNAFAFYAERVRDRIRRIDASDTENAWADFLNDRTQYKSLTDQYLNQDAVRGYLVRSINKLRDQYSSFNRAYDALLRKTELYIQEIKREAEVIRKESAVNALGNVSIEKLFRNPNSFSMRALRDVGYRTAAEIYEAEERSLYGIYGVNEQAAKSVKNAADEMYQRLLSGSKIYLDTNNRTKASEDLVAAIYRYRSFFSDVKQLEDEYKLLQGNIISRDFENLNNLSGGFQWLFMDEDRRVRIKKSYDRIHRFIDSNLAERVTAITNSMKQPVQMQESDPWKDFSDNRILYYTILEDAVPGTAKQSNNMQQNSSRNSGRRKLFCPYDGQELRFIKFENTDGRNAGLGSIPLYRCAYCGRKYTSLQTKADLSKVYVDGKQYTNLRLDKSLLLKRPKIKLSPYAADSLDVKDNYTKPACYIAGDSVFRCKDCSCQLIGAQLSIYNSYGHDMVKQVRYCPSCGTFYIPASIFKNCKDIFDIKNLDKYENYLKGRDEQKDALDNTELPVIDFKDFVVRQNTFYCYHKKHHIEEIAAVIKVMDRRGNIFQRKVSAGYCASCDIYFIMESTFQKLKSTGTILCQVCDEKTYYENRGSKINREKWASESVLMQYGYNVNDKENLSKEQRWRILEMIIDNSILPKSNVIGYLTRFINNHEKLGHDLAVSKWEIDREHITNYKVDTKRQVNVKSIRR